MLKLFFEVDAALIQKGVEPFQRPLHACGKIAERLGVGISIGGPNDDPLVKAIHKIYSRYYRPSDLRQPPMHLGVFMFRDIFFPVKVPLVYGESELILPNLLGDISDIQKRWLFSDKRDGLSYLDQAIDLLDYVYGLDDACAGQKELPRPLEFWHLAKQQLEAAAATLLGTLDKYAVIQNCCVAVELLFKGALVESGVDEKMLKNVYGHNLSKMAEKICDLLPLADRPRLLLVAERMPQLVERRYQLRPFSRSELGRVVMDSQYVGGEILRQFTDRNIRRSLADDPERDASSRTYPNDT